MKKFLFPFCALFFSRICKRYVYAAKFFRVYIRFALFLVLFPFVPLFADETGSLKIEATACEKALEGESPSSVRIRAVDKAVFLGLKNLDVFAQEKALLSDYDLNAMLYRLVDEYVEDLTSKVTKSEESKVCVNISGFVSENAINLVKQEFTGKKTSQPTNEDTVSLIADEVNATIQLKPKNIEDLALVYVKDLEYRNIKKQDSDAQVKKSEKYARFLKQKIENSPFYYLTDEADLADYVITPTLLKAEVDALDATHKRLQMVIVLEVDGLEDETKSIAQNRFLLFASQQNEQETADRLMKKLLEAAGSDAVRQIERKEQKKLEQNTLGRPISDDDF